MIQEALIQDAKKTHEKRPAVLTGNPSIAPMTPSTTGMSAMIRGLVLGTLVISGCACAGLPWVQLSDSDARCARGVYFLLPWFGNCRIDESCLQQAW